MSEKLTVDFGYIERLKQQLTLYYCELATALFPHRDIDFRADQVRVGTKGSLSVFDDGKWYSHECNVGDYDLLSLISWVHDCSFGESVEWAANFLHDLLVIDEYNHVIPHKVIPSSEEKVVFARTCWERRENIRGTLARKYLHHRGITYISNYARRKLGFLHSHKHSASNQYLPCLIAKVQDINGNFAGIQRTYLDTKGNKASVVPNKMRLGSAEGAAIRFSPVSTHLYVCEGIEDALSLQLMIPDCDVWCGIGGNIENMAFPSQVKEVTIAVDNDYVGNRYANSLARRLLREKRLVNLVHPDGQFKDFNHQLVSGKNNDQR